MSSLTVAYGHRRLHVPVSPLTPLAQVRDKACEQFGLESGEYGLKRQGKQLDLTLPYRLANLVANATVEIVKSAKTDEPVRLKVRRSGDHDFVATFSPSTTVREVVIAAGGNDSSVLKLGDRSLDPHATLQSVGLSGAVLLVLATGTPSAHPVKPQPTTQQVKPDTSSIAPKSGSTANKVPASATIHDRNARVVVPSTPESVEQDSDGPSMTPAQFMTYYNHLKNQGEPPLITRSTRERLKQEKRKGITSTTVRVRLPDQHQLEAVFGAEETGEAVYSFVTSNLRHPECQFELVSVSPSRVLGPHENLITDCEFGGRVLLVLRWTGSFPPTGPVLSDKTLASIKSNVPEAKPKAETKVEPPKAEPKPKAKGVPKWLKLQK